MIQKRPYFHEKNKTQFLQSAFGVLIQYLGLRKINTIGLSQANKVMHMSAIAYNLKKYLKFINKKAKSNRESAASIFSLVIDNITLQIRGYKQQYIFNLEMDV